MLIAHIDLLEMSRSASASSDHLSSSPPQLRQRKKSVSTPGLGGGRLEGSGKDRRKTDSHLRSLSPSADKQPERRKTVKSSHIILLFILITIDEICCMCKPFLFRLK